MSVKGCGAMAATSITTKTGSPEPGQNTFAFCSLVAVEEIRLLLRYLVSRLFEYSGRTMNLAFGGEVRRDAYGIRPGEPLSYLHCTDDPNVDPSTCEAIKSAGIQVFPGFQQKVDESRTNIAAYTDLEWSFGDKFMLGTAGRFERYSYFGSTVSGKLSSRYDFTPAFALRGSVNTGFRAPSLHQVYFNNLSTQFLPGASGELEPFEVGTFRNDSDVAKAVGIPPLKQETSLNFSGGAVLRMGETVSLTTDVFRVRVDDRIVISGNFTASALEETAPQIAAALLSGRGLQGAILYQRDANRNVGCRVLVQQRACLSQRRGAGFRILRHVRRYRTRGRRERPGPIDRLREHHLRERGPIYPH